MGAGCEDEQWVTMVTTSHCAGERAVTACVSSGFPVVVDPETGVLGLEFLFWLWDRNIRILSDGDGRPLAGVQLHGG